MARAASQDLVESLLLLAAAAHRDGLGVPPDSFTIGPPLTAQPTTLWTAKEVAVSSRPALGSHALTAIWAQP